MDTWLVDLWFAHQRLIMALAKAGVKLVPDIVAGGNNGGGTLVDVLLANLIRDGRSQKVVAAAQG